MRLASVLLGLPLIATILVALIQGTRHLAWSWPAHAQHHLISHIALAVGLGTICLLLVAGPLRRSERWSWWALAVAGIAIYGGFWLGNATVGLGEPGAGPNTSQAIQSALYVSGLVIAWRELARAHAIQADQADAG
jgi:hypothetical protein